MDRRDFLKSTAGLGALPLVAAAQEAPPAGQPAPAPRTVKLKQSVTRGVFGRGMDLEASCKMAADQGIKGYDLINAPDWPTLKKYGLVSSMCYGAPPAAPGAGRGGAPGAPGVPGAAGAPGAAGGRAGGPGGMAAGGPGGAPGAAGQAGAAAGRGGAAGAGGRGGGGAPNRWSFQTAPNVRASTAPSRPSSMELNVKENHDEMEKLLSETIDTCATNGFPNIIVFSGYRSTGGMSDQEAADNCVTFLKRIKPRAEDKGVNICMELLNSKVNHRGYIFDHVEWGVDVMERVDSTRIGFLYDIYHAQIDDGDVSRTIHNHFKFMKHFHTGGVPGRWELSDDQELNWRYIAKVIADLNYEGFVGHEYSPMPGSDPAACLKQAFGIFNV
jgi:hydroxypyruvate isomerase